jgi:hypothetical protein
MAVSRWLMGHLRNLEHRFLSTHVKYKFFLMTLFPVPLNKFQAVNIVGPLKSFPNLFYFLILALHMALLSLEPSLELFLWEPLSLEYIQHWRTVSSSSQTFYHYSLLSEDTRNRNPILRPGHSTYSLLNHALRTCFTLSRFIHSSFGLPSLWLSFSY